MRLFFARLNAEHKTPHELVGIFAAESGRQLCELIEECCDIEGVEVADIGIGGLY